MPVIVVWIAAPSALRKRARSDVRPVTHQALHGVSQAYCQGVLQQHGLPGSLPLGDHGKLMGLAVLKIPPRLVESLADIHSMHEYVAISAWQHAVEQCHLGLFSVVATCRLARMVHAIHDSSARFALNTSMIKPDPRADWYELSLTYVQSLAGEVVHTAAGNTTLAEVLAFWSANLDTSLTNPPVLALQCPYPLSILICHGCWNSIALPCYRRSRLVTLIGIELAVSSPSLTTPNSAQALADEEVAKIKDLEPQLLREVSCRK